MPLIRLVTALAFVVASLGMPATAWADPAGLVASYSFDEGSGLTAGDSSGNGHAGTITGATWATGRYGGGLDFNGTNASVDLGGLGTFYQTGFTLEAWVQKQSATKNDVAIVGTWNGGGGPMLWVDHIATRYHLTMATAWRATSTPAATRSPDNGNTWPPPTTAPPPASTSTAPKSPAAPSRAASAAPTTGESAPTEAAPAASSTA